MSGDRGGSRATAAFGGMLLVAAAAGAGWWWWTGPRAREAAKREAAVRLARFERCLLGEETTDPEAAARRVRHTALAIELGAEPGDWPSRCRASLQALGQSLSGIEDGPLSDLGRRAGAEPAFLSRAALLGPESTATYGELRGFLRDALAAGLPEPDPAAVGEVPGPPARVEPVALEALDPVGEGDEVFVEPARASSFVVQAMGDEASTVTGCALPADGGDLRCGEPHRVEGRASFRPLARAPSAPVLVANLFRDPEEPDAVWDALAWESRGRFVRTAFVRPDGAIHGVVLRELGKPPHAILRPVEGDAREAPLEAPFLDARPTDALVAGRFAAVRWEDPGKRALTAVHAVDDEGAFGPVRPFEGPHALEALCSLGEGVALVRSADARFELDFVGPGEAGSAHHVVETEAPRADTRCLGDAVSLLERWPGEDRLRVRVTRCDAGGCETAEGQVPRHRLVESSRLALLDTGGRIVAAFAGRGAPVLVVAAPIEQLAEARPRLVMDDATHGGMAVEEPLLVPHREGALLLLRGDGAVRALVLDSEARARPATAQPALR